MGMIHMVAADTPDNMRDLFDKMANDCENELYYFQPELWLGYANENIVSFIDNCALRAEHQDRRIVVATESDWAMGAIQICVMSKVIEHGKAFIHYRWGDGSGTKNASMTFDEMGNIKGAPNEYRWFQMLQRERLIGIE